MLFRSPGSSQRREGEHIEEDCQLGGAGTDGTVWRDGGIQAERRGGKGRRENREGWKDGARGRYRQSKRNGECGGERESEGRGSPVPLC